MKHKYVLFLTLGGCATSTWHPASDFFYTPIKKTHYEIATWQKNGDNISPIHIYIEGDGYAFDGRGMPTKNPTPRTTTMRDTAMRDTHLNVAYIARPCQFIMSEKCTVSDWTDGRFSQHIIDDMADTVYNVAKKRPIILVGYSGGALISGLIIKQHPELNIQKWISIAGVLNHEQWTEYFGDAPLRKSINMTQVPQIKQTHYIAEKDNVVPHELTKKMVADTDIVIIKNATHNKIPVFDINFN